MTDALCIIPARGGSKRIPKKNIKDFHGKPIIAYSIDTALSSGLFKKVMVSTDCEEIKKISVHYGAEVPFLRSRESANDYASTSDVIREVLQKYKEQFGMQFNHICCLYPIAPFVTPELILSSYEKFMHGGYNSLYPVVKFGYPIQRALIIVDDERLEMLNKEFLYTRSQDLEARYHDVGQFYWLKTGNFLEHEKILNENTGFIVLDELEIQDIDTLTDWKIAELKYKLRSE